MITIMDMATGHYECEFESAPVSGDFFEMKDDTGIASSQPSSSSHTALPIPYCQLGLQEVTHTVQLQHPSAKYRSRF